jgi:hypothetical protein
MNKEH